MENVINVDALCLRSLDFGENDAILTLCALGKGKISVSAKGIKKPAAKLKFAASPLCFASYSLAVKGGRYTLTGCEAYDIFYDIYQKIEAFYAAFCVLEVLDKIVYDEPEDDLLLDAVRTIRTLCRTERDAGEALAEFFYKTAETEGFSIGLSECQACGAELEGAAYLASDGGFYCKKCGRGGAYVDLGSIEAVKRFCDGQASGLASEGMKKNDTVEVLGFLVNYLKRTMGFSLKSFGEFLKVY